MLLYGEYFLQVYICPEIGLATLRGVQVAVFTACRTASHKRKFKVCGRFAYIKFQGFFDRNYKGFLAVCIPLSFRRSRNNGEYRLNGCLYDLSGTVLKIVVDFLSKRIVHRSELKITLLGENSFTINTPFCYVKYSFS